MQVLTRWVAVESQQVDGSTRDIGQDTGSGDALDICAKGLRRLCAEECQEVCTETSDVGSGHAGAGNGVLDGKSARGKHNMKTWIT